MDAPFITSAVLAGAPAFVLIWHALRDYDYPRVEKSLFDFQKVFFMLIFGFIFGAVANILRLSLNYGYDPIWIPFLVLVGMALLEESFKVVLLNIKRFQLKFDTTFYGLSLAVGIAAAMAFYDNYFSLRLEGAISDPLNIVTLALLSIGIVALHACTGSVIGYGASKGDVFPSLLQAMVYRTVYLLLIMPFLLIPAVPGIMWMGFALLVVSFFYALLLYWRAHKFILPKSVPDEIKKKRIRELRRKRLERDKED